MKGLTSNQLKVFAIIAMTIDHVTSVVFPNYPKDWWILLITLLLEFRLFHFRRPFLTRRALSGRLHGAL